MNIKILSIGLFKNSEYKSIFFDYISKLPWKVDLKELKSSKHKNPLIRAEKDSDNLLKNVTKNEIIISLDKSGKNLSTENLNQLIAEYSFDNKSIAFLIGGPDGISIECLEKSNLIISFGQMTWPHLLARLMLAEQLYRVSSIISKHPYHRN